MILYNFEQLARVMKLVDIADLKSADPCGRAGSSPAPSKGFSTNYD